MTVLSHVTAALTHTSLPGNRWQITPFDTEFFADECCCTTNSIRFLSLSLLRQLRLNWMSCGGVEKRGASARAEQGFRQVLIRVEYLNPCLASGIHKVWPACKTLQIIVIFTCGDSYAGQEPLIVIIWQSHFLTNKDTLKLWLVM